jgi:hypothetical protein
VLVLRAQVVLTSLRLSHLHLALRMDKQTARLSRKLLQHPMVLRKPSQMARTAQPRQRLLRQKPRQQEHRPRRLMAKR